ncbi:MAG: choice-of-anchor D domain-containing protein, partial [Acidobacteria bacterium]|nr:choice-of-anchor D domain-containing protein [Acidobacteriota bacterium]
MDHDPPKKRDQGHGGGLIDLPMGPGAPAPGDRESPPERGAPAPSGRPRRLGFSATTPRHQRRSRASRPRRSGRHWPVWLVILLAAGAAGYWFFLRPAKAQASLSLLDFGSTRAGRDGEQATVEISNVGRRLLEIRGVRVGGAARDDFAIVDDGCTGASLTAEQSCTIALLFRPQASGGRAADLEITSNAAGEP